jgi:hypothetical protein
MDNINKENYTDFSSSITIGIGCPKDAIELKKIIDKI